MSLRIAGLRSVKQASFCFQIRFSSTNASNATAKAKETASKAAAALSSATTKATKTADCATKVLTTVWEKTVYGAKVGAEVAKEVYTKEQMAPPTSEQLQQASKELFALAKNTDIQKITREDLLKAAYYGSQVYGFFLVGEIIGRFNIVGYAI
ncbi:hypothetical protein DSO57_1013473 [Entomophthora muscae]|uniref:Uncharacterized protein n=1 Tax=Entomophthora muscae TaxID=34485 RepID=A0ACC2U453_9FUNG|nr:hypothetical protein DSO57_1013473 [Entomophthora muscae]